MKILMLLMASAVLFTGCRGADGKRDDETGMGGGVCQNGSQLSIFEDCLSPYWLPSIYDNDSATVYLDGDLAPNASWSIVDLQDDAHNYVIDVEYYPTPGFSDFRFYSKSIAGTGIEDFESIDLSALENGFLVFDLRILSYGNSALGLFMHIQCGMPCRSRYFPVANETGVNSNGLPGFPVNLAVDEWHEMRIPVEYLTSDNLSLTDPDLDLAAVTLISITPPFAAEDEQYGFHYQLDNIRFENEGSLFVP